MKIELTTPDGKKVTLDNISIGGQIKIEYYKSDGGKMIYYLKITNNEKMVLN